MRVLGEYGATGFPIVWVYLAAAAGFFTYVVWALVDYIRWEIQSYRDEAILAELDRLESEDRHG